MDHKGAEMVGGSFLEKYAFLLRIECPTTTLLAALMWKWHLNSDFIARSPFYHLQKIFDGTSIWGIAMRHIGGGLGWKKERYIRVGDLPNDGGHWFWREREKKRNGVKFRKFLEYLCVRTKSLVKPKKSIVLGNHLNYISLSLCTLLP